MVVITRGVFGDDPNDERLHKFIASAIMQGILNVTPVTFGLIKDGMIELMEEQLGSSMQNW